MANGLKRGISRTKGRILVVDDDWAIVELLKFTLATSGFEVSVARSEEEFRREALVCEPDLIVLDIMLGDKDGAQAYQVLLEQGFDPKIPVIFLTVLAQQVSTTPPQPGRTYALVAKPFDPEKLAREIACLVKG